jgi:hypothetical protein
MYTKNATIMQTYVRRWLAKRYVEELKELEYQKQKALLNQALNEMRDQIRVVGTESKERFISAAITIQKHARGRLIRRLLAPYFDLFRKVNPIVHCLTKFWLWVWPNIFLHNPLWNFKKILPIRNAFSALAKNAKIHENSEIISQVDTTEEQKILEVFKKNNQKFLEIQVNQSNDTENDNQTYKMIMSNQNISNHEDFSIGDDSDGEGEDSDDNILEHEQKDKFDSLRYDHDIEPIQEEDGEESKYAPTPVKPVTSKMQGIRAVGCIKGMKAKEFERRLETEDIENKEEKNFKSADANKPKASIKDATNGSQKQLPPKVPNRSTTSNNVPTNGAVPSSYLKGHAHNVPSTTKASKTSTAMSETPKSAFSGPVDKSKPVKKNIMSTSHHSSEGGKDDAGLSRALLLYETPTVASKQKKEAKYIPEETLPVWGNHLVKAKNFSEKRIISATTRTTVTPRANRLRRGHTSTWTDLVIQKDSANRTHIQKDIKIRKNKVNKNRQKSKNNTRNIITSNSNTSKNRLLSKDRNESMKRLGISANLGKKKPAASVEEEKQRIQSFIDSFFQNEANANKFNEAEKRKFAMNFKKAFIDSQYQATKSHVLTEKPKLKALPAPPVIVKVEKKPVKRAVLPSLPQLPDSPKVINEPYTTQDETDQMLGNVKFYSNAFKNNFNFITKNDRESISGNEIDSQYCQSYDINDTSTQKFHDLLNEQMMIPDTNGK